MDKLEIETDNVSGNDKLIIKHEIYFFRVQRLKKFHFFLIKDKIKIKKNKK